MKKEYFDPEGIVFKMSFNSHFKTEFKKSSSSQLDTFKKLIHNFNEQLFFNNFHIFVYILILFISFQKQEKCFNSIFYL